MMLQKMNYQPTMVPENELPTMILLISLVDEQVGEQPAVSEFDDLHELFHDDPASNVDENDDILKILQLQKR